MQKEAVEHKPELGQYNKRFRVANVLQEISIAEVSLQILGHFSEHRWKTASGIDLRKYWKIYFQSKTFYQSLY